MTQTQTRILAFLTLLLVAFMIDGPLAEAVRDSALPLHIWGGAVSWLGNSGWMAIVLILWALGAALMAQNSSIAADRRIGRNLLKLAVVLFLAILISGICVQLLKHLIGRARPALVSDGGAYVFNPLAFDMSRNSFPSGHSTTISAIAMIGALLMWHLRWWFAGLAGAVGMGRVLIGAHFASDVVAGLALGGAVSFAMVTILARAQVIPRPGGRQWAAVGQKILSWYAFLARRSDLGPDIIVLRLTVLVLALGTVLLVLFLSRPEIDIVASALFFHPQDGFRLSQDPDLAFLRETYMLAIEGTFLGALVLWFLSLRARSKVEISPALWAFIVTCMVTGPGLIANSLFKSHWGRARPADVAPFGGEAEFTLPFQLVDQCADNCSFVSGEGSGIAMLFFIFVALAWPTIRSAPYTVLGLTGGIALFGISMRILKGRHFLSDSLFAVLIMALCILVLYRAFDIETHRKKLQTSVLSVDLQVFWQYITGPYHEPWSLVRDAARVFFAALFVGQVTGKMLQTLGRNMWVSLFSVRERLTL